MNRRSPSELLQGCSDALTLVSETARVETLTDDGNNLRRCRISRDTPYLGSTYHADGYKSGIVKDMKSRILFPGKLSDRIIDTLRCTAPDAVWAHQFNPVAFFVGMSWIDLHRWPGHILGPCLSLQLACSGAGGAGPRARAVRRRRPRQLLLPVRARKTKQHWRKLDRYR